MGMKNVMEASMRNDEDVFDANSVGKIQVAKELELENFDIVETVPIHVFYEKVKIDEKIHYDHVHHKIITFIYLPEVYDSNDDLTN